MLDKEAFLIGYLSEHENGMEKQAGKMGDFLTYLGTKMGMPDPGKVGKNNPALLKNKIKNMPQAAKNLFSSGISKAKDIYANPKSLLGLRGEIDMPKNILGNSRSIPAGIIKEIKYLAKNDPAQFKKVLKRMGIAGGVGLAGLGAGAYGLHSLLSGGDEAPDELADAMSGIAGGAESQIPAALGATENSGGTEWSSILPYVLGAGGLGLGGYGLYNMLAGNDEDEEDEE